MSATWRDILDHPNTRCLNVRQPWATLLAQGIKDVENRTVPLPANDAVSEPYCWVLLVASGNTWSRSGWHETMNGIQQRLEEHQRPYVEDSQDRYPRQSVVAVAKMASSGPKAAEAAFTGKASVWNHGDKYAWEVLEVHALPVPIWYGKGSQSIVRLTPGPGASHDHRANMHKLKEEVYQALLSLVP